MVPERYPCQYIFLDVFVSTRLKETWKTNEAAEILKREQTMCDIAGNACEKSRDTPRYPRIPRDTPRYPAKCTYDTPEVDGPIKTENGDERRGNQRETRRLMQRTKNCTNYNNKRENIHIEYNTSKSRTSTRPSTTNKSNNSITSMTATLTATTGRSNVRQ